MRGTFRNLLFLEEMHHSTDLFLEECVLIFFLLLIASISLPEYEIKCQNKVLMSSETYI